MRPMAPQGDAWLARRWIPSADSRAGVRLDCAAFPSSTGVVRGRGGFTLMEVLVSLTLAGIVALLLHRGLGELGAMEARAAARREQAAHAAAVRREIAGWLRGAYVEPLTMGMSFEGSRGEGQRGSDRLRFHTTTSAWPRGAPATVDLRVEPGAGLVASVDEGAPTSPEAGDRSASPGAAQRVEVLEPAAEGLDVRYRISAGGDVRWVTSFLSAAGVPDAVELRIRGAGVPPLLQEPVVVVLSGS
ncbi:MAG TPA: prepilin-type N-terminal cleavage/methylation domain-containing protein [Longimicrobiaceae bacterium]|nr:prepilin-type N-terminal cleavage/methylation domain-containing protein [Longimicrobiaceae bacterium]